MRSRLTAAVAICGLIALLVALVGCGSPTSGAGTDPMGQEVRVTLTEMAVQSTLTTFTEGKPYHFVVTNAGKVSHELRIAPPMDGHMQGSRGLPTVAQGSPLVALQPAIPRHGGELMWMMNLKPGETRTLDYTFRVNATTGTYEIACHYPGHYETGMKLPITILAP